MTTHHTKLLIIVAVATLCMLFPLHTQADSTCWQLPNPSKECLEQSKTECKNSGGKWFGEIMGRGRNSGCHKKTTDGNKHCTTPEECEGRCNHDYKCSEYIGIKGCFLERDKNGKIGSICVE